MADQVPELAMEEIVRVHMRLLYGLGQAENSRSYNVWLNSKRAAQLANVD